MTYEKAHGRHERRMLWVVPAADLGTYLAQEYGWQDVQHVGWVLRQRRAHRAAAWTSEETTIVTSLPPQHACPARLLQMLRGHWGIENRVHWVRDVTYQEDRLHARRCGHALASLRNTAMALIRFHGFAYVPDGHAFVSAHLATAISWLTDKLHYRQN